MSALLDNNIWGFWFTKGSSSNSSPHSVSIRYGVDPEVPHSAKKRGNGAVYTISLVFVNADTLTIRHLLAVIEGQVFRRSEAFGELMRHGKDAEVCDAYAP
jgi:hypothetical protein